VAFGPCGCSSRRRLGRSIAERPARQLALRLRRKPDLNLHAAGYEFEPKATRPTPGFCRFQENSTFDEGAWVG
jgi:hypothetical protein